MSTNSLLIGIGLAALAGLILYWLLIRTEGIYLGRRVVIWLYDLYAGRYDNIKRFDPDNEDNYLAQPLLSHIPHIPAPLVLDVATGTGRLPLALLDQATFQGRIIGLDLSRKMIGRAARKLTAQGHNTGRVYWMHHEAEALPFPTGTFDVVTCLEALEFMMDPRGVLAELVRVLRPGGLLVITNRQGIDARLMLGHTFRHEQLERILRDELALPYVAIQAWQVDYRIVWAFKGGTGAASGPRTLEEVWQCPGCGAQELIAVEGAQGHGWRCMACETFVPLGADGVIEAMSPVVRAADQA